MKKLMLWLAMVAMILGTVAFPATAGATDQYDEESESSEIEELFPSEDESSESEEEDSAAEGQYDDEGLFDFESTIPEETTDEETTEEDPFEDETTSEETPEDETTTGTEETTSEETTSEETTPDEETTSGEPASGGNNDPDEPSGVSPTGGTQPPGESGGGSGVPAPPVTTTAPPEIGQEITVNIIDHDLTLTIVDIYDGGVIYLLPDGERYEILLYDLDYDGWISYYEMYICTAGWFGYRYYDYTPDDMYRFIGNTYNINISNTYQDTGAIRPTPTERVKGMLPETGGPALIGGAVALAVVGAALVGRYSKRS